MAMKATTRMFFEHLLPIFSLTYSFLPYKQPLKDTDNSSSQSEDDSEPEDNALQEEEELFDDWRKKWEHLEEDSMHKAPIFNPSIEVHDGQRLFDEALGGKELAMLIQAASQLGFAANIKQILTLVMIKLGHSKVERCHDILSAFLDTMLLRKIGRTLLETHKADICSMVAVYTRRYLTPPIDNLARPRSECDCFRCKALVKYLEDPNLETQVFVNESLSWHRHLLQQVQMAHYRFTWDYRYGPTDILGGRSRARYPDAWSSELRKKRFPKPWIASKGYECVMRENDHVHELTVKKTSRAQEKFEERLYKAGKLEAKVAASRLGASFWDEARKSARSIDRIGTLQSHRLAAAEAKAKRLIAALAQEVASTPTRIYAAGLGGSEKHPVAGISPKARGIPPTASIATPQSSSKVVTSKVANTERDTAYSLTAKIPTASFSHKTQEGSSGAKASFVAFTAAQSGKATFDSCEGDLVTTRLPDGDKAFTQASSSQTAKVDVRKQASVPKAPNVPDPNVATLPRKIGDNANYLQPRRERGITTDATSGTRSSRSATVSKKEGSIRQSTSVRSFQSSKRVGANRRMIPDSDSDDIGSHSDYESTQCVTKKLTSMISASTGSISSNSRANPVTLGLHQSAQRCDIREPDRSAIGQDRGYTSALRTLQQGVWALGAEQVCIDLDPSVLFDDDFLLGLDKLSKDSTVSWKDALAVLRQVQKERKDDERKRAVTTSNAWLPSDTIAALARISLTRTEPLAAEALTAEPLAEEPLLEEPLLVEFLAAGPPVAEPLLAEPLATKPLSTDTSPLSFSTPTPKIQSTRPENQSTTPPGDPPSAIRLGPFAPIATAVFKKTSKGEEQIQQSYKAMVLAADQNTAIKIIGPFAGPVNVEKRQSAPAASSTSEPFRGPLSGSENPRSSGSSELSFHDAFSRTFSTVPAATRVPVTVRPQSIVGGSGKANAAEEGITPGASTTPEVPSVQQARLDDDSAKSHNSQAESTEVITLDATDSEDREESDGMRAGPARLSAAITSTTVSTPQATSPSFNAHSQPKERITHHGRQAFLGSTDGPGDTLPGVDVISRRNADTTSSPWPPPLAGSRATELRDGKASAIASSQHDTLHWRSSHAQPLDSTTGSPLIPVAILERFKNGGNPSVIATRAAHTSQNVTSNTIAEGSRTVLASERSIVPTAQMDTPSTSATKDRRAVRPELHVTPVASMMPVSTDAGKKRSADNAGLLSTGRPDSTRRKTDAPNLPTHIEVIDLLDSDEECVLPVAHMLPGRKNMPIFID